MQNLQEYHKRIADKIQQSNLRKHYAANRSVTKLVEEGELLPPIRKLERRLSAPISDHEFKCECSIALEELTSADRNNLMDRLADEARAFNEIDIYQAPFRTQLNDAFSAIELLDGKNIHVFLIALDPLNLSSWKSKSGKKGITIQPFSYILKCLSGSGWLTKYALESAFQDGSISSKLATETTDVPFEEGSIVALDKGKEGLTFSRCEKQATFITVALRHSGMMTMPQYSIENHRHVGTTYSEPVTPRIQTATVALRMLDYPNTIQLLRPFLSDQNMYLRWQAAREIFMIDPGAAKSIFVAMREDPSAQIRNSADRCLADYYGES